VLVNKYNSRGKLSSYLGADDIYGVQESSIKSDVHIILVQDVTQLLIIIWLVCVDIIQFLR
jgi:hypothetical protein